MGALIKYIFYLILICAAGVAGYAMISDLPAPVGKVIVPIEASGS